MRALAEAPQLLMHYLNIDYDYVMSWDYYNKEWSELKSLIPFKQLPMIVVDGEHQICQSIAIMSYVESISGTALTDPILIGKASSILQSAQELFMPLNPTINFAVGDDFKKKCEGMMPSLLSRFEDLEKILLSTNEKFFIDDTPRACDFATFHHLDLSKKIDEKILENFPRLAQFINDISSINSIKSYLEKRPELIDVSIKPKLVIDGIPHPTGTQQT